MENIDYARKITEGKKTLDIGCMGTNKKAEKFKKLDNASYLLGIDITAPFDPNDNLMYCDIENSDDVDQLLFYHGKFEVIVMLEVIEHLGNMYDVLNNIKKLLTENGIIVLSTPNAISEKWIKQVKKDGIHGGGKKHIHWYDKQTITSLFELFNFKLYEIINKDLDPRLIISFYKDD